jgi:predicted RNA-binding protein (virulence factor B family)
MISLGKRNTLAVIKSTPQGIYLDGEEHGEILLPGRYVPAGAKPGDKLDVFLYLDSEDRWVATTETPLAEVGQFAVLEVIGVQRPIGAFLNWGLPKDLLLPFREQAIPVRTGERVVVFVYLDPKTGRIAASSRLNRHLSRDFPTYRASQPVRILIVNRTPLGYNALVENAHIGLLYGDNIQTTLEIGQQIDAFVRQVRDDGKIDLSLDASGYQRVIPLTGRIVELLEENGGHLDMDDDTDPEVIRFQFGVSKKAFKQALGRLYKQRQIRFTKPGIALIGNSPRPRVVKDSGHK